MARSIRTTRIQAEAKLQAAEAERDCYLKNLEDAQGDIAAEVADNQRLRVKALALVETWREQARRVRPLESAPSNTDKRKRTAEYIMLTNRANELASLLTQTP